MKNKKKRGCREGTLFIRGGEIEKRKLTPLFPTQLFKRLRRRDGWITNLTDLDGRGLIE